MATTGLTDPTPAPGIDSPPGVPRRDPRITAVIRNVTFVGISAHSGFILLFWWLHVPLMAWFNVASVICWAAARNLAHRGRARLAVSLLACEVTGHAVVAVLLLGWESGFQYYLIPLLPFLIFSGHFTLRGVVAASAGLMALFALLRHATHGLRPDGIPAAALRALEIGNIVIPLTTLALICFYYRRASVEIERRMETLAMTDALTQLPNRRRMRELLTTAQAVARRGGREFGVIIADLDNFKAINDTRGHDCGDHALREVAAVLRGALRGQDSVARWGGEEFLFLLPDTDREGAVRLAEKLRVAVESAPIDFAGEPVKLTMTFGATSDVGDGPLDQSIRRADRALYEGKRAGKNRVTLG